MNRSGFNSKLIAGILLAMFFGVALYLRVALPYPYIFDGNWIKLSGVDSYFLMRLVDNLVHNFPHLITLDPYYTYPPCSPDLSISIPPFFCYLLASLTWLIGLGSPTQHTVDIVGVYFPAILGALTVIPVYFIGKALFSRWAGVIAAGLIAIFPGEFLGRSILGFTDYHVAEVLFTTVTMLFLILAVKAGRDNELTFDRLLHRQWAPMTKPLIYSLLAGIFLGIYILTWAGALLFVFIIFIYLIVQFIIDHLKSRSTDYLCFVSTVTFIIALLTFLPVSPDKMLLASLAIAIIIPVAIAALSRFMASHNIKPIIYPAALLGLGLVSLAVFRFINPSLLRLMLASLNIFSWPIGTTVFEMEPLLLPGGNFSLAIAWGNFTTSFFLCFISLGILIYLIIKRGETDKTLFVIWSLMILAATLSMRRFAYYFAINVALLAGYFAWLILEFCGFKTVAAEPAEVLKEAKKKAKHKRQGGTSPTARRVNMALGVIAVFFLVLFPNIGKAIDTASYPSFAPSDAWCESLSWLKDNTPDPFDNPDFYYKFYEPPPPGEHYDYPQTVYGVTAWWDYGYWIARIGRRIPISNPGTGNRGEASVFTAQDEASANELLNQLGSKYIIIDHDTATVIQGKFHAVATLSGSSSEKFYGIYYQPQGNMLKPVILFYPEYYRSLVVHLYNFNGSSVIPKSSMVISYQEKVGSDGQPYKQITDVQSFDTYAKAHTYITSQKSGNYRIVGANPYISPVPLEALEHYKLVYSSKSAVMQSGTSTIPEVKIFEYAK